MSDGVLRSINSSSNLGIRSVTPSIPTSCLLSSTGPALPLIVDVAPEYTQAVKVRRNIISDR